MQIIAKMSARGAEPSSRSSSAGGKIPCRSIGADIVLPILHPPYSTSHLYTRPYLSNTFISSSSFSSIIFEVATKSEYITDIME